MRPTPCVRSRRTSPSGIGAPRRRQRTPRRVSKSDIAGFAALTGDEQWIHTDASRAREGPFGTTIAHGYLTLSLVFPLLAELLDFTNVRMVVNYGLNRVRFPSAVPAGARIRLAATVTEVTRIGDDCYELVILSRLECDRGTKPAAVVELIYRAYE
ncbi:MaoC family dehydratase [Rhodococcus koreensis]|uniref:MaoC family dehydratase n=1 Tax=Rhodococcus koreensis TaxID=99653 RepID=UPI00210058BF|nr:MaoC family dehydratase [Rhodococcus koreensis]